MTALPPESDFTGPTRTNAQMRATHAALRQFLAGLFGDTGAPAPALVALGAPLSAGHQTRSAATVLTAADRGRIITATAGTWALTLPAASAAGEGWCVAARNIGTGTITLTRAGADLIDGAATLALLPGSAALVVCTGGGYITLLLDAGPTGFGAMPDGTAGTPGIRFALDPDTGFTRPAANQIGFAVGGALAALLSGAAFQLDVPLTGLAVTASRTDVTAGRLLRFGASPLQLSASPALRVGVAGTGNARVLTSGAGFASLPVGLVIRFRAPGSNSGAGTINLDGLGAQPCVTITGAALPSGYIRTDADTVAMFDGTNWVLDRAAEAGSNANGRYLRLADGSQICWVAGLNWGDSAATGTGTLADPYRSVASAWTFPAGFLTSSPIVTGMVRGDSNGVSRHHGLSIRYTTSSGISQAQAIRLAQVNTALTPTIDLLATGNWY